MTPTPGEGEKGGGPLSCRRNAEGLKRSATVRPFRSAIMASASDDEMIITTGVIVSTIHCLMLPIAMDLRGPF